MRTDESEKEHVGQRARIMRKLRRALDDDDSATAKRCVRALEEDDESAKRADDDDTRGRARRADDQDLDDDDATLDDDEMDDEEADEDDLGGAPRAKRAKRAKKARRAKRAEDDEAKRADDDELDDDEMTEPSGHGYDDSAAWRTEDGMRKHEKNSRFDIPRFDQADLREPVVTRHGRHVRLTGNAVVRRAREIAGKGWYTMDGRYEAMMRAASEIGYRGRRERH